MWNVDNLLNKAIATFAQMEMAGIKPTLRAVLTTHAQSSNHTLDAYVFFRRRGTSTRWSQIWSTTPPSLRWLWRLRPWMRQSEYSNWSSMVYSTRFATWSSRDVRQYSRRGIPTNVSMSAKMFDVVIRNGGSYQLSYTAYLHTISHMHA